MLRRDLLKSALASSAGALALASAGAADAGNELESVAAELTKDLYANDGLVLPIPTIQLSLISLRAETARSRSAAAENITLRGTAAFSTAYTIKAST